jgi:sulfur-oxidizing protein SoxY
MNERQIHVPRRALLVTLATAAVGRYADAALGPVDDGPWPALAQQIFNDRAIRDGSKILAIDAPYRAEDAAVVPVEIHNLLTGEDIRRIRSIALVIDQNPSPLAAVFAFGPTGDVRSVATRVRVESYTNFHAVAELSDGQLYGTARFVKAAGGCSAPAAKEDADAIPAGTMRFRQFPPAPGGDPARHEVQLMIRHPNYSGMQMNQVTRLYVPARFVKSVRIWQGQELLISIDGGISIAENPEFRFDYHPNGAASFKADIEDSDGKSYQKEWAADAT